MPSSRICQNPSCQKEFLTTSHKIAEGKGKYCSKRCMVPPRIMLTCEHCKNFFDVPPHRKNAKVCSRQCEVKNRKVTPVCQRVEKHLDRASSPYGCWLWTGSISNGYGYIKRHKQSAIKVIKVLWEEENGPVPQGMEICHNCPGGKDNKACCRPSHMFLGTHAQNMADASKKGLLSDGANHRSTKLNSSQIQEMHKLFHDYICKILQGKKRNRLYPDVNSL